MKRSSVRLQLEQLENRLAPAAFIVTTGGDNGDDANPMAGSLRAAIMAVDAGKKRQYCLQHRDRQAGCPGKYEPIAIDHATCGYQRQHPGWPDYRNPSWE